MNPIIRNILAFIAGWIAGSIVNMGLVKAGHILLPIEGIDPNDMEALAEVMPDLGFEYFIFPFLAHAIGTLVGAMVTALLAASHRKKLSMSIGVLFLLGGIMVNYMISGPLWFTISDIVFAYIPMAWIGTKIAIKFSPNK